MNNHLIGSIKPGNIYVLYFKNGNNIILEIINVNSKNGSVRGYDCFGMLTILCIHGICGYGKLVSFPRVSSEVKQNRITQDVNERHKSNKSYGEIPLERERVVESDPLLDIKSEKAEKVTLVQEYENALNSVDYISINNPQPNDNLINNIKQDSSIAKERNSLLSLKIISINGNSIIKNSGGSNID